MNTKTYFFVSFLIFQLFLLSCNKDNSIKHNQSLTQEFVINGNFNLIETFYFPAKNIPSFYEANKSLNGYSDTQVDKITSSRGEISQLFSSNNLSFIEKISVRVYPRNQRDNFKEMYYFDFVPITVGESLKLFSGLANLKEILSSDSFDMELGLKFRSFVPAGTRITLNYSYNVVLN